MPNITTNHAITYTNKVVLIKNSGALAREARQRSTMGNKIWQTIHLIKFGYDVAYARPPARPPIHTLHVSRF